MKKMIIIFYIICVSAAAAIAFGVDMPAFAGPCYGNCGDPI